MWSRAQTKQWKKLANASGRRELGLFLVEGVRCLEEALAAGWQPQEVVLDSERPESERTKRLLARLTPNVPQYRLPSHLLERMSQTVSGQGLLASFPLPAPAPLADDLQTVVVLDGVQDPGNVGSIVRHAAAFGGQALIVLPETADPFGPKAVRASMGGIFQLPCIAASSAERARTLLRTRGYTVCVLRAEGGRNIWHETLPPRLALVVGAEARGPGPAWHDAQPLHIPQSSRVESCNAAFAASLLLAWRYGVGTASPVSTAPERP